MTTIQKEKFRKQGLHFSYKMKATGTLAGVFLILTAATNAQTQSTQSSPRQMVDALHSAFGKHPDARAVHAKGLILEGNFSPDPMAKSITQAAPFIGKTIPVTFRFSDFTGIPDIPDTIGASNPRGLAIKFHLPDNTSMDIVSHSFNGFPVSTTDEFRTFLLAISKSGPQAAHPSPIEQFLGSHPIAKSFVTSQKPPSVSYATLSYFGVNAFKFKGKNNAVTYIRYQFIPVNGEEFLSPEQVKNAGPDYLSKEIVKRIADGPIAYKMYAQISEAGDKIGDPGIAWPASRKLVLLGILTINQVADNTMAQDKAMIFNPGNLPVGIEIADQMLKDRQQAYPISVAERRK
ncbi:MAG: catalase family peroxidase [Pedobacter sp.]|uniref:catalase family peroxidase n=1 Tax=Pedobacter sp. TaxID=1411316 RepID=UPI003392DF93